MRRITFLRLGNYYGQVELRQDKTAQYYLTLDNWDDTRGLVSVSEEFAKAVIKEFGGNNEI